jgi:O-succinylbenzoic acid--CoA ligase
VLLDAWLPRAAALRPRRAALVTPRETLTYAELARRAAAAAGTLRAGGVRAGDPVAVALPSGVDFTVAVHACLWLGAPAVPIDLRLSAAERAARTAGARRVLTEPVEPGEPVPAPAGHDADTVATVMHTSGTTGGGTRVELTYANWHWNALGSALALGLDPAERWLDVLPLSHVGGLSILLRSAIYATTAILHERFDAATVAAALDRDGVTLVSLVPTTLQRALDAGLSHPPALRCCLLGGGPCPPALLRRATAAGVAVAQTYGMTEACSQVATSLPGEPQTAGRALAGARVEIAPDGEILVRGPTVAPGAPGPDGFLHTGDLGALDERGRLTVTGRRADTIVSGGENVAPTEVEAVLLAHPAVADAAVHARPDAEWGEAVVATVVLADGARTDAEELRAHCAAALAGFKVPKAVAFTDRLPRTVSGKLRRALLRSP